MTKVILPSVPGAGKGAGILPGPVSLVPFRRFTQTFLPKLFSPLR